LEEETDGGEKKALVGFHNDSVTTIGCRSDSNIIAVIVGGIRKSG
jgi:hypothetical protein